MTSAIQRLTLSAFLFISMDGLAATASYLDTSLTSDKRVELLMNQMTLDEKIAQMCQFVGEASDIDFDSKDTKSDYTLALGDRAGLIKEGKIGSFLKVSTYQEANILQSLAEESRLKIPTTYRHGRNPWPWYVYGPHHHLCQRKLAWPASFEPELAELMAGIYRP